MKLYKLATFLLAVTFVASGQTTTTATEELEKLLKPVKGTLEHDARLAASAAKTMRQMESSLRLVYQTVKKGPKEPSMADKALLARLVEAFANQGSECSSLTGTFHDHSALLLKKALDFMSSKEKLLNQDEKDAVGRKIQQVYEWKNGLEKSIPVINHPENAKLMNEILAYVKPPKPK